MPIETYTLSFLLLKSDTASVRISSRMSWYSSSGSVLEVFFPVLLAEIRTAFWFFLSSITRYCASRLTFATALEFLLVFFSAIICIVVAVGSVLYPQTIISGLSVNGTFTGYSREKVEVAILSQCLENGRLVRLFKNDQDPSMAHITYCAGKNWYFWTSSANLVQLVWTGSCDRKDSATAYDGHLPSQNVPHSSDYGFPLSGCLSWSDRTWR